MATALRTDSLDITRLSGSLDYDFGFGQLGKSHLTLALPLLDGRSSTASIRRLPRD